MVARALELGFALNNNIVPEVSAVGVAIRSRFGPPFAAPSVSAPTSRMMHGQRFRQIARWLESGSGDDRAQASQRLAQQRRGERRATLADAEEMTGRRASHRWKRS
jgi:hypothetical protein